MRNRIAQIHKFTLPGPNVALYCGCKVGEHHGWLRRVTFSFVLETEALFTFQHTTHWPDLELTLNSHRNMILVPAELRLSFTSAIVT